MACCCLLGLFGSPKAVIFLMAAASSRGSRARALRSTPSERPLEERDLREERDDRPQVLAALDPTEQHEDAQEQREDEQDDDRNPGPERHRAIIAWAPASAGAQT